MADYFNGKRLASDPHVQREFQLLQLSDAWRQSLGQQPRLKEELVVAWRQAKAHPWGAALIGIYVILTADFYIERMIWDEPGSLVYWLGYGLGKAAWLYLSFLHWFMFG